MATSEAKQAGSVRVGLIGYGYAGKTFHAPSILAVDNMPITVVGSSKGEELRSVFPSSIFCAADEVPTHPDVDLVVIATPNDSHYPLAKAALLAGKDVVIDKPFTVTLEEARSLRSIAQQQGRLLSVFHNRRWESEILAAKQILDSGELGRVTHFECHMDRFRPNVRRRWREDPGPGAGLWFDLGPHLIDLSLYLFGLPDAVHGSFAGLRDGAQTDDWAHIQLLYPHMRIVLNATLLSSGGMPRALMHGTTASWAKYGQDVQEDQLKSGMSPRDPAFGIDPTPCYIYDGATGERREIPSPRGNQKGYYEAVRDAILHGSGLPVTARDAITTMAILETSFRSGQEGRVLPLPLTEAEKAEWSATS
ncbi:MAG: oxidoreductase [Edaphobacter sp.]|uniref:oxidoreductase n=1 Tax=Edaphobacter sp. TaxID=1934404 RepID=UPI0023943E58|nr:oxidoreductase [Edaphobacter sp.]MDE1177421.1 oxidoreductase [Edaphobacter sp.]